MLAALIRKEQKNIKAAAHYVNTRFKAFVSPERTINNWLETHGIPHQLSCLLQSDGFHVEHPLIDLCFVANSHIRQERYYPFFNIRSGKQKNAQAKRVDIIPLHIVRSNSRLAHQIYWQCITDPLNIPRIAKEFKECQLWDKTAETMQTCLLVRDLQSPSPRVIPEEMSDHIKYPGIKTIEGQVIRGELARRAILDSKRLTV